MSKHTDFRLRATENIKNADSSEKNADPAVFLCHLTSEGDPYFLRVGVTQSQYELCCNHFEKKSMDGCLTRGVGASGDEITAK